MHGAPRRRYAYAAPAALVGPAVVPGSMSEAVTVPEERFALTSAPVEDKVQRGKAGWWEATAMLVLSLGLALALFHRDLSNLFNSQLGGAGDADEYSWFLSWVPFAISHGLDPLVSTYVNHPGGVNLMWNTSVLLPSFMVSPLTLLFGAAFSYNVLVTLGPVLSSAFAFLAFRRWTGVLPACAGALVFGFSPYVVAQSVGHLAQSLILTAPLFLVLLDRLLVVQDRSPVRDGALLGLLAWAQLLSGEEVLAMEVLSAAAGIAALCLLKVHEVRSHWRYAAKGGAVAGAVFGVLSAPFLAVQYFGPYRVQDVHPANAYVSDLLNFFVPTNVVQVAPSWALSVSAHFTGNGVEQDAYIGIPLFAFLVLALWLARRRAVAWVAGAIAAGSALLSMGPTLHVLGHVSRFPLPGYWLAKLPVVHNLLPSRFASMTALGAGLLVALGLHELKGRRLLPIGGGWALLGSGMVLVLPTLHFPANASPIFDQFSSGKACPTAADGRSGAPPVALVVPSGNELDLRWQAEAGFCFVEPSATGMTGTSARAASARGALLTLASPSLPPPAEVPAARAEAAQEVRALDLSEIIVAPQSPAAPNWSFAQQAQTVRWLEWLLGRAPQRVPGPYTAYVWGSLPPVADIASGQLGAEPGAGTP